MQMLWDRGEGNGYAHHVVGDPLPGTPDHNVLMHVAVGDHQVTTIQADVMARTIGASVRQPAIDDGPLARGQAAVRHPGDRRASRSRATRRWSTGTRARSAGRERRHGRDRAGAARRGAEPHAARTRTGARARTRTRSSQKVEFMLNGDVIDVCGSGAVLRGRLHRPLRPAAPAAILRAGMGRTGVVTGLLAVVLAAPAQAAHFPANIRDAGPGADRAGRGTAHDRRAMHQEGEPVDARGRESRSRQPRPAPLPLQDAAGLLRLAQRRARRSATTSCSARWT